MKQQKKAFSKEKLNCVRVLLIDQRQKTKKIARINL